MAPADPLFVFVSKVTKQQLCDKLGSKYIWQGTSSKAYCPLHCVYGVGFHVVIQGPTMVDYDYYIVCPDCIMENRVRPKVGCPFELL